MYRTSYTDMNNKVVIFLRKLPKLINTHYLPKYGGTVPGMKSENPFASSSTRTAKEKIVDFDRQRFNIGNSHDYKEYILNNLDGSTIRFQS